MQNGRRGNWLVEQPEDGCMATEALEAQMLENTKKGLALGLADVPEYVFMDEWWATR